jgi:hypothetical protein
MHIFVAPDGAIDSKDRAIWVTPPFSLPLAPPAEVVPAYYTGPVMVSWSLGVNPDVQRKFWMAVHARGVADGKILSHYLDVRPNPTDEPQAMNLPPTVNPLKFLLGNLLRGNTLLVRIKSAEMGKGRLNSNYVSYVRKILPPHVLLLLQVEMPALGDAAGPGTDSLLDGPRVSMPLLVDAGPPSAPGDSGSAKATPEFTA